MGRLPSEHWIDQSLPLMMWGALDRVKDALDADAMHRSQLCGGLFRLMGFGAAGLCGTLARNLKQRKVVDRHGHNGNIQKLRSARHSCRHCRSKAKTAAPGRKSDITPRRTVAWELPFHPNCRETALRGVNDCVRF